MTITEQTIKNLIDKTNTSSLSLRHDNGLYSASDGPHYHPYVWLRDLYMQTLDIPKDMYMQSWKTFLDYAVSCEDKYKKFSAIINYGRHADPFHIRWSTYTNDEIQPDWGHLQFDAWGMALIAIAKEGDALLRDSSYKNVVKLMIESLYSYRFWEMPDVGMWEENHEVRQSSVAIAACGLHDIKPFYPELIDKIDEMIKQAKSFVKNKHTRETNTRDADLAQLFAVHFSVPRDIMLIQQARDIITNIENKLVKTNGVIRYEYDDYYNINSRNTLEKYNGLYNCNNNGLGGGEAEWTFGFPILIMASKTVGMPFKESYLRRMVKIAEYNKDIPELFYSQTNIHNDNSCLGWSCNLYRVVFDRILSDKAFKSN